MCSFFILLSTFLLGTAWALKGETFCRDEKGNIVDYWIILKAAGSAEYVLYTSVHSSRMEEPLGLSSNRRISVLEESAFLQTIYGSAPDPSKETNNLLLAWNDQQPKDFTTRMPRQRRVLINELVKIPGVVEIEKLIEQALKPANEERNGRDMYGRSYSDHFAHSKGFLGLRTDMSREEDGKGTVEMYYINHSFPHIPEGCSWKEEEAIKRRFIPLNSKHFFGPSTVGSRSMGQHAFCISMTQEVDIVNGQIVYERERVKFDGNNNLFALLDGLDVIGPSMTLTNYVPWEEKFKVYHQLFNTLDTWSSKPINKGMKIESLNLARVGTATRVNYSPHAFPLWPSHSRVIIRENSSSISYVHDQKMASSLRNNREIYKTRCQVYDLNGFEGGERRDPGCFSMAKLVSTSFTTFESCKADPLIIYADFKNALVQIDTDNIIASHLVPLSDFDAADAKDESSGGGRHYSGLVVVTQSWYDHASFASRQMDILNSSKIRVRAWFHNSILSRLPCDDNTIKIQLSPGNDHSKWFVSYLYGQLGTYQPIAGVMDLNRNAKHSRLRGKNKGRGGVILTSSHPNFVSFFMRMAPILEDNSDFSNIPLSTLIEQRRGFLGDRYDEPITKTKIEQFHESGIGQEISHYRDFQSYEPLTIKTPYSVVPRHMTDLMRSQLREVRRPRYSKYKRRSKFVTGEPGFTPSPFTPTFLRECPVRALY